MSKISLLHNLALVAPLLAGYTAMAGPADVNLGSASGFAVW